jgi:hypothetical protein
MSSKGSTRLPASASGLLRRAAPYNEWGKEGKFAP